ncbi:hypothetical protein, partial [Pseudonocardia pini]|uniref:hypothetical protein n=1 Tax=Pseudonocardia pini TaxID=2758030 RepID=UPI001C68B0CB
MTDATSTNGPREPIPDEQLSDEQRANLAKLRGIGSAVNAALAERGLDDVMVYSIQFGPRPDTAPPQNPVLLEPGDGALLFDGTIEPDPITLPPPGGCYCTSCDDQGRC